MVVFYRFSLNSLHEYENEYREEKLLSFLVTLPNDLEYTHLGDSRNAIDTTKLFYDMDYGFRKIIVEQVYPQEDRIECDIHNYPECNTFVYDKKNANMKNAIIESRPVSLYYPLANEYKAGKLTVHYYY